MKRLRSMFRELRTPMVIILVALASFSVTLSGSESLETVRNSSPRNYRKHSGKKLVLVDPTITRDATTNCSIQLGNETVTFEGCTGPEGNEVELFWTFQNSSIKAAFRTRSTGREEYVGVGLGFGQMIGSKAAVVYSRGPAGASAAEYVLEGRSPESVRPLDTPETYSVLKGFNDGAYLAGYFERALDTNPAVQEETTEYIWAKGEVSDLGNLKQHESKESKSVDLSSGAGAATTESRHSSSFGSFFVIHGVLMAFAWVVIAPIAVLSARFLKSKDPLWFQAHRASMVVVVAIVLAAYIMGVVRGHHEGTLTKVHLTLGTIVLALALAQASGGILRPATDAVRRESWRIIHSWSGRFLIVLAFANLIVGLRIFGASRGYYIATSVVFGLLIALGVAMDIGKRFLGDKRGTGRAEVHVDSSA